MNLCSYSEVDMVWQVHSCDQPRTAVPRTTPRGVPRDVRVVDPCVTVDMTPVSNTQKAQRVQADEDRRNQQPLRDGFVMRHANLILQSTEDCADVKCTTVISSLQLT